MNNLVCSGPGPHVPASGILGQTDVSNPAPVLCPSTACQASVVAAQQAAATASGNQATLQARATAALTANATFLAVASPTQAQTVAQVQMLTKETSTLIRLLLGLLDTTSGT